MASGLGGWGQIEPEAKVCTLLLLLMLLLLVVASLMLY